MEEENSGGRLERKLIESEIQNQKVESTYLESRTMIKTNGELRFKIKKIVIYL